MADADITFIRPHEMNIEHCRGCGSCSSSGKCVIRDDMHRIYDCVEKNEIIILATPIYFSGPSSIMKQVIDRFQCVWAASKGKKKGKAVALIAAGGSPSPVFINTISIAKAFAMTVGAEWSGELIIGGTDGLEEIPEEMFREAYSFGSRIAASHF
jgi:multimeric flavodoxin WrbA